MLLDFLRIILAILALTTVCVVGRTLLFSCRQHAAASVEAAAVARLRVIRFNWQTRTISERDFERTLTALPRHVESAFGAGDAEDGPPSGNRVSSSETHG